MEAVIVDAFISQSGGGNGAGVMFVDSFPSDEEMTAIAARVGMSETAFIKRFGSGYRIRYFTPLSEVALCGHATVASFAYMSAQKIIKDGVHLISTKAGMLSVSVNEGLVMLDMARPDEKRELTDAETDELCDIMGVSSEHVLLTPALVSTGLYDIILGLDSREALFSLKPDNKKLIELSKKLEVTGVHAFALNKSAGPDDADAFCRNFAPVCGIDEESATGTASGALTYYLYKRGVIKPDSGVKYLQGESMSKPSDIYAALTVEQGGRVNIRMGGMGKTRE